MARHGSISDTEMEELVLNRVPINTRRQTGWAISTWNSWASEKNSTLKQQIPFVDKLLGHNIQDQCDWLSRFVCEVRTKTGGQYSKYSLEQLVHGLHRKLKDLKPDLNILDNPLYNRFQKVLDGRLKRLTSQGIGIHQKQAQAITEEEELELWNKGIMSTTDSVGLFKAVFFYVSKAYGLRSGDEHRELKAEQFIFGKDGGGNYVEFLGRRSKTYHGGLGRRQEPKRIKHYDDPQNPRSLYQLLFKYVQHIPAEGAFYRRPMDGTDFQPVRFSQQVIGINLLKKLVSCMMEEGGIQGYFTNHSLKRTCGKRLFNNFNDPLIVKSRTGHTSNAVERYKEMSTQQQQLTSQILDPPPPPTVTNDDSWVTSNAKKPLFDPTVTPHTENRKWQAKIPSTMRKPHTYTPTAYQQEQKFSFSRKSRSSLTAVSPSKNNGLITGEEQEEIKKLMSRQFWDTNVDWTTDKSITPNFNLDMPDVKLEMPHKPNALPSPHNVMETAQLDVKTVQSINTTTRSGVNKVSLESVPLPDKLKMADKLNTISSPHPASQAVIKNSANIMKTAQIDVEVMESTKTSANGGVKKVCSVSVPLPAGGNIEVDISCPIDNSVKVADAKLFPMNSGDIIIITLGK